jgi:magnesium-transporting ATPase (P-type)
MGASEGEARNIVLFLLVLFENAHVFNVRSERRSAFTVSPMRNPYLLVAVVVAQLLQFGAPFVPGLNHVLAVEPLPWITWLFLAGIALTIVPVMELSKALARGAFDAGQDGLPSRP